MPEKDQDLIALNGIDARTGRYLVEPMTLEQVAALARQVPGKSVETPPKPSPFKAAAFNLDPTQPASVGWGLVFGADVPKEVREALRPLYDHRVSQVSKALVKVLDYKPGETMKGWLKRNGSYPGTITPQKVPYYLLLVGDPTSIPFEFQYLLDIEYAVGRIAFDRVDDYGRYAKSVVDYETSPTLAASREVAYWGTRHNADLATQMSADNLITPLFKGIAPSGDDAGESPVAEEVGFRSRGFVAQDATRANLTGILHPANGASGPSVLVTASHGMGFPKGDPNQPTGQGALLAQDWPGFNAIAPEHFVQASDVGDDANVHGLVAFLFACYGLGTPAFDAFLSNRSTGPTPIADRPFIAALPKRLLAHPKGGALAVLGHVERAWGYSIRPPGLTPQIGPLRNFLGRVLSGQPVGHATKDISEKYAAIAADLLDLLDTSRPATPQSDAALARAWIERNDSQNYALLGDPAARLRLDVLK